MQFITTCRCGSLEYPFLTAMLVNSEDYCVAMVHICVIISYRKNGNKLTGIIGLDATWI
jgi:hypothetical protein